LQEKKTKKRSAQQQKTSDLTNGKGRDVLAIVLKMSACRQIGWLPGIVSKKKKWYLARFVSQD
jgi:hypothetical protein